jgi:serine protease Do
VPQTVEQLREIERRVGAVVDTAGPATVGLMVGRRGAGSGVVIDEAGTILTAAHVIGEPGRPLRVFFPDGSTAMARSLGSDVETDTGMAKLEGEGPWPFVPLVGGDGPAAGDWVVALGHPAGFNEERPTTVRLGRVIRVRSDGSGVQSDCTLIGGDSGGPLLNLEGQVVGIHSRIGPNARTNIHVGAAEFRRVWDRLASGERWGERRAPLLGIVYRDAEAGAGVDVQRVMRATAAAEAGLRRGDRIVQLNGLPVRDQRDVFETMSMQAPGDTLRLTLLREQRRLTLDAVLGEAP